MRPKIGDVFAIDNKDPITYHIYFQVTKLPRGAVHGKVIKVLKMNHSKDDVGKEVVFPKYAVFGSLSERWYNTTRLPKSKYPEYYL